MFFPCFIFSVFSVFFFFRMLYINMEVVSFRDSPDHRILDMFQTEFQAELVSRFGAQPSRMAASMAWSNKLHTLFNIHSHRNYKHTHIKNYRSHIPYTLPSKQIKLNMGASLLSFGLDTGVRSHQPEKKENSNKSCLRKFNTNRTN